MVRGYAYKPQLLHYPNWTLTTANNEDALYAMLANNHVEFILCDVWGASLRPNVKVLKPIIDYTDLSLLFRPHQAALATRLDGVIGGMIDDGSVERFYGRYTSHSFRDMLPSKK